MIDHLLERVVFFAGVKLRHSASILRSCAGAAVVAVSACVLLAQSQPPPPGQIQTGQKEQNQADRKDHNHTQHQEQVPGREGTPPGNSGQPNSQAPIAQSTQQQQESTLDRWLDRTSGMANVVIAMVTIALGVIAYFQIAYLRLQIAESHRPRIHIRSVGLRKRDGSDKPVAIVQLANVGASNAKKIHFNGQWFVWAALPLEPPIYTMGIIASQISDKVAPGYWHTIEIPRFNATVQGPLQWSDTGDDYIAGYIRYADDAGKPRITAFCRRLNPATGRFERVGEPDFEYED